MRCSTAVVVLATLARAATPSRSTLEGRLVSVSRSGNWRSAVAILDQLVDLGHSTSTKAHNNAAAACSRAGRHTQALELLDTLRARGGAWDAHSYTTAVTAHGKSGQWRSALSLLQTMEEKATPAPNVFVYGAVIGACAVSSRWEEAVQLLQTMESRGVPPTTRCFNGALLACDRAGQPDAALALLDSMRTSRRYRKIAPPSVVSYSTALSALSRKPSLAASQRAVDLLAAMRAEGVRPNAHTYGAAALAHGASGAWESALQLLSDMDRDRVVPTGVVLCNVLNACAVGGAYKPALAVLRGMRARYDIEPDAACVNAAIKACARGGEWRSAVELLESLGVHATERSYLSTLSALANCARWREALDMLKLMHAEEEKPIPSVRCYTAAIAACGAAKQWKEAVRLWAVLLTTVPARADTEACAKVLNACIESGQWRAALRVLEHLHTKDIKPVNAPAKGGSSSSSSDGAASGFGAAKTSGTGSQPPPKRSSSRRRGELASGGETRLINRVCVLHDQLTRNGALDNAISFEAALHACEKWKVGEQLADILEALGEENRRCLYEAERAALFGVTGAQLFEEDQLGVEPQQGARKRRPNVESEISGKGSPGYVELLKLRDVDVWETFVD